MAESTKQSVQAGTSDAKLATSVAPIDVEESASVKFVGEQSPGPGDGLDEPGSPIDESLFQVPRSPTGTNFASVYNTAPSANTRIAPRFDDSGGTADRAAKIQARTAKRPPRGADALSTGPFSGYKASGNRVRLSEVKVGIMPNVEDVLEEIAAHAGVDMSDEESRNLFLEAMVVDVYVNPYSDKQPFDSQIAIQGYSLERFHIKEVIEKYVGTMHRRFARAMAPLVVAVMRDNYDTFGPLLDKRASDMGVSTRAEALYLFDGADVLVADRATAKRSAEAKALALAKRGPERAGYFVAGSSAASGDHSGGQVEHI